MTTLPLEASYSMTAPPRCPTGQRGYCRVSLLVVMVDRPVAASHRVGGISQQAGGSQQLLPDPHQPVVELEAQAEQQAADPGPHAGLVSLVFVLVLLDLQLPLPP